MTKGLGRLGTVCLGIYLLIQGLVLLIGLSFIGLGPLLGVLALLAGVLILAGR